MNLKNIFLCAAFLFFGGLILQAQDNLESLVEMVQVNKAYALYKAKPSDKDVVKEKKTHYIKLIPAKYQTIFDTIVISPALDGNLDTSNYFIQTEVITSKESIVTWKTATVSPLCRKDAAVPHLTLSLTQTVPDYRIIHTKFYPFRNILDTTSTDYIIPAEKMVIERLVCTQKSRIYYITDAQKEQLSKGEKLLKIPAGKWKKWQRISCPIGEYAMPSVSSIQKELKRQAYDVKVTGEMDTQTKKAIVAFQQDNLLEIGDPLSPETLKRMDIKGKKLISIDLD